MMLMSPMTTPMVSPKITPMMAPLATPMMMSPMMNNPPSMTPASTVEPLDYSQIDCLIHGFAELSFAYLRFSQAVVDVNSADAGPLMAALRAFVEDVTQFARVAQTARLEHLPLVFDLPGQIKGLLGALLEAVRSQKLSLAPRPGLGFRDTQLYGACVGIGEAVEKVFSGLAPVVKKSHHNEHQQRLLAHSRSLQMAVETLAPSGTAGLDMMEQHCWLSQCAQAIFRQSQAIFPQSGASVERSFRLHLHVHHVFRASSRARASWSLAAAGELRDACQSLSRELDAAAALMSTPGAEPTDELLAGLFSLASGGLHKHSGLLEGLSLADPQLAQIVGVLRGQAEGVCRQLLRLPECLMVLMTIPKLLVDALQQIGACCRSFVKAANLLVNSAALSPHIHLNNIILLALTKLQHLLVQISLFGAKRALSQQPGAPTLLAQSILGTVSGLSTCLLLISVIQSPQS